MDNVKQRASEIDVTLGPLVGAEMKRFNKGLERIERKMLRAEKRLHEEKLKQIEAVKDALFPGGKLQERTANFLNFHQKDPQFVSKMVDMLDPFDYRFNVVSDD